MTNHWQNIKLGDIARLVKDGYTPAPEDNTPYIGLEHIEQQNLRLTGWGIASDVTSTKAQFKAGDILFGKLRPYFRKAYRPKFDGICSTDIWVIRAKQGTDQGFLFYLLASYEFIDMTAAGSSGTRMPRADWKYLSNAEWRWKLPPLTEQRQIAAILSSLDDKIEVNQRMNRTLEQLAQTLFQQWFVAFDFPDAAGRPYRSNGGELVESKLGEIPKGWQITTLAEQVEAIRGLSYKGSGLADSGLPMHNLNSILEGGGYKHAGIKYYSGDYKERHKIKPGDIIVSNTEQGHKYLLIGYPAVVPQYFGENGIFSQHLYRVRPKAHSYLPNEFLYYLLISDSVREQILGSTNGTTVNMLAIDGLQKPIFVYPDSKIASQFAQLITPIWRKQESNLLQSRTLTNLRDTLLPQLLSGRLTVQQAAEVVA